MQNASETAQEKSSSIAESVSDAAQTAKESVQGAAQSLGAAAGFGGGNTGYSSNKGNPQGEPSKTVYVGNLFFDVRAEDLKQEFERAGAVQEAKIIMDNRGMSKG